MFEKLHPDSSMVLVNCWHDSNKGDAAITIGLINAIRTTAVTAHVDVVSYILHPNRTQLEYGFRHVRATYPDIGLQQTTLPALSRSVGKLQSLMLSIRAALKLLMPGVVPDRDCEKSVRNASVVVSTGGLYFGFAKTSFLFTLYHLFALSYPLLLAKRLGIPYVLYAQSFGPFRGSFCRWWMRMLIAGSSATWPRESHSRDALMALGAPPEKVRVIPDAAFGFPPVCITGSLAQKYRLEDSRFIAISARSLESSGHPRELALAYKTSLVGLINWMATELNVKVAIVAHTLGPIETEDDRPISQDIYDSIAADASPNVVLIEDDLSPAELCELYWAADLLVATRFHAAVLAINGGVPVIAIPYFGLKTQGSLNDLGLGSWIIDLKDLSVETLKQRVKQQLAAGDEIRKKTKNLAREQYDAAIHTGERLRVISNPKQPSFQASDTADART